MFIVILFSIKKCQFVYNKLELAGTDGHDGYYTWYGTRNKLAGDCEHVGLPLSKNASTWQEHIGFYWKHLRSLLALLLLPLVGPLVLLGGNT